MTFINNYQHAQLKEKLNEHFQNTECMERDRELEKFLIQKSKIELKLLININAQIFDVWEANQNAKFTISKNKSDFSYSSVTGFPRTASASSYFKVLLKKDFRNIPGNIVVPNIKKTIFPLVERKGKIIYCKSQEWLYGDKLIDYHYKKNHGKYGEDIHLCKPSIKVEGDSGLIYTPLVYFFALCHGHETERKAVEHLETWFKISDNIFSTRNWHQERSGWEQHKIMVSLGEELDGTTITDQGIFGDFTNKTGYISHIAHRDVKHKTLLPITAWTKDTLEQRYYLNIPPSKPYPLLNLDTIHNNKDAVIVLTDSIEIALENDLAFNQQEVSDVIWTSWYGEKQAVEDVQWKDLKKRKIYYLIKEYTGVSIKEAFKTAQGVLNKLKYVEKIDLTFIEYGKNNDFHFMSCEEFEEKAVSILEGGKYEFGAKYDFNPATMKDMIYKTLDAREFLLKPIILERSSTLIYAKTNVGKTWLALCMGFIVSVGGRMLKRWNAPKSRKVLYIDSEMDEKSLQDRVRIIARMRFEEKKYRKGNLNKNFFCISKKRDKVENEKFKKYVINFVRDKKISLIVLDNLTAFTQHNDSAKAWEDIHLWIDKLKAKGCAVIIIHHTNKAGEQRGTSATTNAVDNVIHLKEENIPEEARENLALGLSVHIEKGRDIYGDARKTFIAKLGLNSKSPCCQFLKDCHEETLTAEDNEKAKISSKRKRPTQEILKMLSQGRSINDIAYDLDISVSSIYQIEGLRECKEYKEMIKQREDKKSKSKQLILNLNKAGKSMPDIVSQTGISIATVHRTIDSEYIKKIKPLFENGNAINEIIQKTGLTPKTVQRIIKKIKIEKIPDFCDAGKTLEFIQKKLDLPAEIVQKEMLKFEQAEKRKLARKHELEKLVNLHHDGVNPSDIIKQVDLPARTIKIELNRLQAT